SWNALATKLFSPYMLHVTTVLLPSGLKVNSLVQVDSKGRMKSSLMRTSSCGRLSIRVMRPSPTLSSPDHAKTAPVPAGGPSKEFRAAGSSFAHGDHSSQWWKSFTCGNTADGGAEIVAERTTRKVEGCKATKMTTMTTI